MNTKTTAPWHWTRERVIETLATRIAMAAMSGRPTPVAAAVLARLEGL